MGTLNKNDEAFRRVGRGVVQRADAKLTERNPHAIGNEVPEDTDGRLTVAARRAKTIGDAMQAISRAAEDHQDADSDTLLDLGQMALELAWELDAINTIATAESWRKFTDDKRSA